MFHVKHRPLLLYRTVDTGQPFHGKGVAVFSAHYVRHGSMFHVKHRGRPVVPRETSGWVQDQGRGTSTPTPRQLASVLFVLHIRRYVPRETLNGTPALADIFVDRASPRVVNNRRRSCNSTLKLSAGMFHVKHAIPASIMSTERLLIFPSHHGLSPRIRCHRRWWRPRRH